MNALIVALCYFLVGNAIGVIGFIYVVFYSKKRCVPMDKVIEIKNEALHYVLPNSLTNSTFLYIVSIIISPIILQFMNVRILKNINRLAKNSENNRI